MQSEDPSFPSSKISRRRFCLALGGVAFASVTGYGIWDAIQIPQRLEAERARAQASAETATLGRDLDSGSAASPGGASDLMEPFINEAKRRRDVRLASDPEYASRVDQALNKNRINFVLYSEGITYEPYGENAKTWPVRMGIHTIYSYNLSTGALDTVSLTHDVRDPSTERHKNKLGRPVNPTKIYEAYNIGGFDLMRTSIENATGLCVDFQMMFNELLLKEMVDKAYDGLSVDVPFALETYPIVVGDRMYDKQPPFKIGTEKMDGLRIMQYIKGIAKKYDRTYECNIRKGHVQKAMIEQAKKNAFNPVFWTKFSAVLVGAEKQKLLAQDFDLTALLLGNVSTFGSASIKALVGQSSGNPVSIRSGRQVYVVDSVSGDGGVMWVQAAAATNAIVRDELAKGLYIDKAMAVPYNANPYAENLPRDYWRSVRDLVKNKLS